MARTENLHKLPEGLPEPADGGTCDHLPGMRLPSVTLISTAGELVNLSTLPGGTVVYCYSRTGKPDEELPRGWNETPGARGCTPQSCAFRDHHEELRAFDARLFGLSTQDTEYQREAVERLHLPFELLSDKNLAFARALKLPTFKVGPTRLIKRLTLVINEGRIEKVFYPIFPPDSNAEEFVEWLSRNSHKE